MDARLGKLNADGGILEWPAVNIYGSGYTLPATSVRVGDTTFVIVPAGFTEWDLVEALKSPTKKAKKVLSENSESGES